MNTATPLCAAYKITETHKAIYQALRHDDTFVAFLLPGEPLNRLRFMADIEKRETISDLTFSICPWNTDADERIVIRDTITAGEYLKNLDEKTTSRPPSMQPCITTTDKLLYKGQVLSIVTDLRENFPSKTVLSRVICDKLKYHDPANVWLQVAHDYFKAFKNTFRFIYFTRETGCWIGASPELLLSVDKSTGDAETVALAGTRRSIKSAACWDEKNTNEQGMVVKFIMELFEHLKIDYKVEATDDVAFGHIKHKCDHFSFNLEEKNAYDIIDMLSPTPALSGYPRSEAIAHIDRLEMHNRNCYGGYVAVDDSKSFKAFVNLRCAHFYKGNYCIYTGSGLTEVSKAEDEWTETENKISILKALINGTDMILNILSKDS